MSFFHIGNIAGGNDWSFAKNKNEVLFMHCITSRGTGIVFLKELE